MTSNTSNRGLSLKCSAVAIAALMLMGGCGDESAPATQPAAGGGGGAREAVAVTLAPVRVEAVDVAVELTGTLYGDEQVTISAKVPGRISATLAEFGDRVTEGTLLAQIDKTDYELAVAEQEASLGEALSKLGLKELPAGEFDPTAVATVQRAKVQADNSGARLDRARKLFEQQPPLISSQDFADIETTREVARRDYDVAVLQANSDLATARVRQNALAAARQRLADTRIAAPQVGPQAREGRFGVTRRDITVGSYVREGDPLFVLVADDPIRFRADVPERFNHSIKIGQTVRLTLEGGTTVEGKVARINPSIDIASRTFQVEATVANPDHALRPGAFARASIITGKDEQATFVPKDAVASFAGVNRVFSVKDGKAAEHQVQVGEARGNYVRVTPNLKQVQSVALGPVARLGNGMTVKVEEAAVPQAAVAR